MSKASVTIVADFSPGFNPPFFWRSKHQKNQSTESTAGQAYMQRYNGWQAQIQVLGLEGAKFGEGSRDGVGPQQGPGRIPGGGPEAKIQGSY